MLHGDRNVGLMLFCGRDSAVPKVIGERLTLSLSVFDRNRGHEDRNHHAADHRNDRAVLLSDVGRGDFKTPVSFQILHILLRREFRA